MTVIELIKILNDMPHNSKVYKVAYGIVLDPRPEMVWDDENSKYEVVL